MAPISCDSLKKRFGPSLKLDIGCGANPQPGFVGIDCQDFGRKDIIRHDIETYPWPFEDGVFRFAMASHVAEHINPAKFGFINWMNEVWRVLEVGAQFIMAMPYGNNSFFVQDPTHVNQCNEVTWNYFDPLHESGFYRFYRPRPWKICSVQWTPEGFMEVVLEKRQEDASYGR